jgi:hypothetical protein
MATDWEAEITDSILAAKSRVLADPDDQETAEREEAAAAYLGENEQHFIDLLFDSVDQSAQAMADVREEMAQCWDAYNEREPAGFREKMPWQARTVVPKPHEAVNFGASAISKAFTPEFITVDGRRDPKSNEFWKRVLTTALGRGEANFPHVFTKATQMGMAVGISKELIPYYAAGHVRFKSVDPWKIDRDPDAESEDPQSGTYWIHSEWVPWHVLRRREEAGVYRNVARVREGLAGLPDGGGSGGLDQKNWFLQQEYLDRRRKLVHTSRSKFRPLYLTSVFCGDILSPRGELLLQRGRFTASAGRVIQPPVRSRLLDKRWPGTGFSPLPNLIGFSGGRGMLNGVLRIWEAMCNLMCLHEDALKWLVNPPREINVDLLEDPRDVLCHPGKHYLTRSGAHGQQAIRTQTQRDVTNSVLANMQYLDQVFQAGSNVTSAVQGLPGWRSDMTWRESSQNLSQAMSVYTLMGENIEAGAVSAIETAREIIEVFFSYDDYRRLIGDEALAEAGVQQNMENGQVLGLPAFTGRIEASGIQAIMRDAEVLDYLVSVVIPLTGNARFAPFMRPYQILRALEKRTNLKDEALWLGEEEAQKIETAEIKQFQQGVHINLMSQRAQMAQLMGALLVGSGGQAPVEPGAAPAQVPEKGAP